MRFDLSSYRKIIVEPVSGTIGAEIGGVDLSGSLDGETFAEIREAFLAHHVLFFRNQNLDPHSLAGFAERFGPLTLAPQSVPIKEHPFVSRVVREANIASSVRNIGDRWHSDQSPRERPNLAFALYCVDAPDYGGDTMFANLECAYEALSEGLKRICEGLTVIHSASGMFGKKGESKPEKRPLFHAGVDADEEALARTLAILDQEMEHPLVRVHADTGRRCLYVTGEYCIRFVGMTEEESAPLLKYLHQHVSRPEFTCRFRWRKGSLALLDNRCTQHYAINDYAGFRREMLRVEMDGERPLSIQAAAALAPLPAPSQA